MGMVKRGVVLIEMLRVTSGPTSVPVFRPHHLHHPFRCTLSRNCLTSSIIWWYSGYTYSWGEVLMLSNVQQKVMSGRLILGQLARVFAVICASLLVSAAAYPQGSTGRILGVVTDQSGGNVAGATLTITDVA